MKYANTPNRPFNMNFSFKRILSTAVVVAAIVIVSAIIFTGFYTVPADSEAVLQRFGKYTSTEDPGLHFKISKSRSFLFQMRGCPSIFRFEVFSVPHDGPRHMLW